MRTFPLVALVVLLAGCLAPSAPQSQLPGPGGDLPAWRWSEAMNVTSGTAEPGLELAKDGTIWIHAPGGLWKSAAAPLKFEAVALGPGPVLGGDAAMAIGKDGTLYYSDLEQLVSISVFASKDNGKSWTENAAASDTVADDRQWLATGPDASPTGGGKDAAFLAYNHLGSGPWVTVSTDGGTTWVPHTVFPTAQVLESDVWTIGNVVVDAKGVIFVPLTLGSAAYPAAPSREGHDAIVVVVSSDGGLTWTRHDVDASQAHAGNLMATMALDSAGTAYVTWATMHDGEKETDVWLSSSSDHGATWTKPLRVSANPGSHAMPWVATGPRAGDLALVWYEVADVGEPPAAKGVWHVQGAIGSISAGFREFRVSPDDVHKGGICVQGTLCQGGRGLLDFFQARVGPDGRLHVIYANDAGGRANVVYRETLDAVLPAA